jgi:4-hydroxy-tetrahydrodipicolinate reductase
MIQIGILGAMGRMGIVNIRLICQQQDMTISYICEHKEHPLIGKDIGLELGLGSRNWTLSSSMEELLTLSDTIIDFTTPDSSMQLLKTNHHHKKRLIIGTTGMDSNQQAFLTESSKQFPIVFAPNFSLGVTTLFHLIKHASRILNVEHDYDLEIIETHHRRKQDAPSGTALRLAELAAKGSGRTYPSCVKTGRDGKPGIRTIDELGVFALRLGDTVGEHRVCFGTEGETLELAHQAHNREAFAKGALLAARFIQDQEKGVFDMEDVLGFTN